MSAGDHPYSPARIAGEHVYVSGALSVDPSGAAVSGRRDALDAAMARLEERLTSVGASLSEVVKVTYFVTDVQLRDDANIQFDGVFQAPRPARTFVEVSALPYGASVELDAIAFRQGGYGDRRR